MIWRNPDRPAESATLGVGPPYPKKVTRNVRCRPSLTEDRQGVLQHENAEETAWLIRSQVAVCSEHEKSCLPACTCRVSAGVPPEKSSNRLIIHKICLKILIRASSTWVIPSRLLTDLSFFEMIRFDFGKTISINGRKVTKTGSLQL